MTHAEKCPVCEGRGKMPRAFYHYGPDESLPYVQCLSCLGSGYIVVSDPVKVIPQTYPVPYPVPYPTPVPYWPSWRTTTSGTDVIGGPVTVTSTTAKGIDA